MIPRGVPDIGWRDLLFGLLQSLRHGDLDSAQCEAEAAWSRDSRTLACLSVRSGFDLVLQALALPPGSELLVSAVTIPHMLEIIERHGLRARPVDVDPHSLALDCRSVAGAISGQTRALLVAHLWGSRMPLDGLARLARRHGLLLIEDCAQAFDAQYHGHAASDISMWSFGPIKTATALGGALLCFRDRGLYNTARRLQAAYPLQSRRAYAGRICTIGALKLLATPVVFGAFVALCRARGIDHDTLIFEALRSYRTARPGHGTPGGADLPARLRRRPCAALLRLLARRVASADRRAIEQRARRAERIYGMLPSIAHPGDTAAAHTHWMVPIVSRRPDELVRRLWQHGFDATTRGSSLTVAQPAEQAPSAAAMLAQLVYLPVYPRLSPRQTRRLCRAVLEFEHAQQVSGD